MAGAVDALVQTELVVFEVLHDHKTGFHAAVGIDPPNPGCSEANQAGGFGVQRGHPLVSFEARGSADVEMEPILDGLVFRDLLEKEPRTAFIVERQRGRAAVAQLRRDSPRLERLVPTGETGRWWLYLVAEHLAPKPRQCGGIGAIKCDLDLTSFHVPKLPVNTVSATCSSGMCSAFGDHRR